MKNEQVFFVELKQLLRPGEFAGTEFIFDFEGSIIEGIARFFLRFQAEAEKYFYIYSNRIPFVKKFMGQKIE